MKKSGMLVGKREVNLCSRLELHFTPTEKIRFKTDEIGSIISC